MTFAAYDAKVFGKRPVWLYEITYDGTTTRLTSQGADYTYNAQTYTGTRSRATAISHSRIVTTREIKRSAVNILLARTDTLAETIRDTLGPVTVSVRIKKGYANDPDQEFLNFFYGRVVAVKPALGVVTLNCESSLTEGRRRGISAVMQRPCPWALYFGNCRLNIADFNLAGTATDWTAPNLTVTEASGSGIDDGYYDGGIVTYGASMQMILKHTGTTLRLLAPIPGLADEITASGSASVSIAPGCNRSETHCEDKFDNLLNFGGETYMDESPFDGRNPF